MLIRARGSLPMVLEEGPPCPSLSLQNLLTLPQGRGGEGGKEEERWLGNAHGTMLPSRMTIPWPASPCWATV